MAWAICRNPIPYPNPVLPAPAPAMGGSGSSRICGGPRRMLSCSLVLPQVLLRPLLRCDLPSAVCRRLSSASPATSLSCLSPPHSCSCGCQCSRQQRSSRRMGAQAPAPFLPRPRPPPPAMPLSPRMPEYSRVTRESCHIRGQRCSYAWPIRSRRATLVAAEASVSTPAVVPAWALTLQPPRGRRRSVRRGPKRGLRCCDLCSDLVRGAPRRRQPPGPAPHLCGKTASHTQQPPLGSRRCCVSPACIPAGRRGRACCVSSYGRVCHVRLWRRRWRSLPDCQVHEYLISSCTCCARRPGLWR